MTQQSGGGAPSGPFSYALVSNQGGQTFTPGEVAAPFTIDAIQSLPAGFEATVGGDTVTITRSGIYLAVADSFISDTPLSTGKLAANLVPDGATAPMFFNIFLPLLAALTDWGGGYQLGLLRVATTGTVQFATWQSDSTDHLLVGDLFLTRLGSIPS